MKQIMTITAVIALSLTGCAATTSKPTIETKVSAFDGKEITNVSPASFSYANFVTDDSMLSKTIRVNKAQIQNNKLVFLDVQGIASSEGLRKMTIKLGNDFVEASAEGISDFKGTSVYNTFKFSCKDISIVANQNKLHMRMNYHSGYSDFYSTPEFMEFISVVAKECQA